MDTHQYQICQSSIDRADKRFSAGLLSGFAKKLNLQTSVTNPPDRCSWILRLILSLKVKVFVCITWTEKL